MQNVVLLLVSIGCGLAYAADAEVKVLLPNQKIAVKDLGSDIKAVSCSAPVLCKCEIKDEKPGDDRIALNRYDPENDRKLREVLVVHGSDYPNKNKAIEACTDLIRRLKDCNSLYEKAK